jgi:hypothetical protein
MWQPAVAIAIVLNPPSRRRQNKTKQKSLDFVNQLQAEIRQKIQSLHNCCENRD